MRSDFSELKRRLVARSTDPEVKERGVLDWDFFPGVPPVFLVGAVVRRNGGSPPQVEAALEREEARTVHVSDHSAALAAESALTAAQMAGVCKLYLPDFACLGYALPRACRHRQAPPGTGAGPAPARGARGRRRGLPHTDLHADVHADVHADLRLLEDRGLLVGSVDQAIAAVEEARRVMRDETATKEQRRRGSEL